MITGGPGPARVFVRAPEDVAVPYPPSSRIPPGPRRRSLLASAAGAALLTGCSAGSDDGGTGPSAAARARARAARDSRGLLGHYDAVLAAHPGLAERLRPLRAQVAAHAAAFEEGTTATASATATASGTGTASASAVAVPAGEKEAVAGLAGAERALADRRAGELLKVPGELARLLASVAAAGAAHAYLLTEGAR
ncbi:lipoprotein [Streptomyces capoamus]|uniref:Lipoprotein n=1 Tax=Streptomyces capoamus TaxID=68183 RepID=A0A919C3Q0_9ACTN|nr:lipoprotein [Streptomyces libani subsp. rufus]GHG47070.1 lipoprotein [Streptomyces capoamus]